MFLTVILISFNEGFTQVLKYLKPAFTCSSNSGNLKAMCEIYLKLTIKAVERRQ